MKAEGKNPVRELLNSGATIEKISVENGSRDNEIRSLVQIARDKGVKVDYVDKRGLDKVSETGHHQGIIAFYTEFKYAELNEVINNAKAEGKDLLFVILDEV